jgi:hypothetical protein
MLGRDTAMARGSFSQLNALSRQFAHFAASRLKPEDGHHSAMTCSAARVTACRKRNHRAARHHRIEFAELAAAVVGFYFRALKIGDFEATPVSDFSSTKIGLPRNTIRVGRPDLTRFSNISLIREVGLF